MCLTGFLNNSGELKQLIKNLKQIDEVNRFSWISIYRILLDNILCHKLSFVIDHSIPVPQVFYVSINCTPGKTWPIVWIFLILHITPNMLIKMTMQTKTVCFSNYRSFTVAIAASLTLNTSWLCCARTFRPARRDISIWEGLHLYRPWLLKVSSGRSSKELQNCRRRETV